MNNYYVYFHINPLKNEIFYVGKGKGKRAFEKGSRRGDYWNRVVKKYGYIIDIVEDNLTEQEAFEREMFYIKKIGRKDLGLGTLINMTDGGEGTSGCKKDNEGDKNPMYNRNHSDKTKRLIGDKAKKRLSDKTSHPMYGKRFNDESKDLKSKSMKKWLQENEPSRKGKKNTKEHIDKYKNTVKERGSHSMGNNSKAIKFIFEGKIYNCLKELWIEKYSHMNYRYWLQKFDRNEIVIL